MNEIKDGLRRGTMTEMPTDTCLLNDTTKRIRKTQENPVYPDDPLRSVSFDSKFKNSDMNQVSLAEKPYKRIQIQ